MKQKLETERRVLTAAARLTGPAGTIWVWTCLCRLMFSQVTEAADWLSERTRRVFFG